MNHIPRKRFGQHFLSDSRIADRIVDAVGTGCDDHVLEIGPGLGVLTKRLLERGVRLTAIEIDRDVFRRLKDILHSDRFRLVEGDILAVDLEPLFEDIGSRITVVSNLPYNISTPVIEMLAAHHTLVKRAVLMLQKEVADRLLAKPGSRLFGLTTLNLSLYGTCRNLFLVRPGSFSPPPKVMSRVIEIVFSESCRYDLEDKNVFRELTGTCFRQRRKMIRNTFGLFLHNRSIDPDMGVSLLEEAGIAPEARPETLETSSFVRLSNEVGRLLRPSEGAV